MYLFGWCTWVNNNNPFVLVSRNQLYYIFNQVFVNKNELYGFFMILKTIQALACHSLFLILHIMWYYLVSHMMGIRSIFFFFFAQKKKTIKFMRIAASSEHHKLCSCSKLLNKMKNLSLASLQSLKWLSWNVWSNSEKSFMNRILEIIIYSLSIIHSIWKSHVNSILVVLVFEFERHR